MNVTSIPYGRQQITEADIEAVVDVLKSQYLTQGPRVNAFEKAFANYIGSKFAVAVTNGTAALHLSAMALGVGPGKRVISSPLTFAASTNCVLYCGGIIEFCDVDSQTLLLDINLVRKKLEASPKGTYAGIIPVDFAGAPVDMEAFRSLADEFNLFLLEDSCHAPGGYFVDSNGEKQNCGNCAFADAAIFSFHPVKHIACGEGGMITTNDQKIYKKLLRLRTHGITKDPKELNRYDGGWYYEMHELGYNYRLSDINAALGLSQLQRATKNLAIRRDIAANYNKSFKSLNGIQFMNNNHDGHAFHLAVIKSENRNELYEYLKENQIYSQVHYIPVHLHPYYQLKFGFQLGDFPKAEEYYKMGLSLPIYPDLTKEQNLFIIDKVKSFFNV